MRDSVHRMSNLFSALWVFLQYLIFGTGILITVTCEYFCFLHTRKLPPNHEKHSRKLPDLELFWVGSYVDTALPESVRGKGTGAILVQCAVPKSIGTVRLSTDGADDVRIDPIVDPKFLSFSEDWDVCRRGLTFALEVGKEMANGRYPIQELTAPKSSSPKDLDQYIRETGIGGQHLLSSCRMKPLADGGVVDRELRVYGILGLRIADGSVFPRMVASRPQASVLMVGERCAAFIRSKWECEGLFGASK
jgi:choline dehydrogenase